MIPRDPVLLPEILIILFIIILLVIAYINMRSLRNLSDYTKLSAWPRISVLIPARNEEEKIGPCVRSLLAQDYRDFQVIVLDDNSDDGTGEVLESIRHKDKRLQVIHGKPLPPDWLGKHWACHQLYQAADGEYLMFTDSDTVHSPQTLSNAAAAMADEKAGMISIIPRHILGSLSEKLVMPFFALGIFAAIPMLSRFRPKSVTLLSSSGKLMMFRRNAYERSGGFEGIKQNVLDDLELPQRIQASGFRYRLFDGTNNVSCRMYHNFKEVHEGLSKNMFASYQYNVPVFILTWMWILFAAWEPIITLYIYKIPQYPPTLSHGLAAISIIGILLLWAVYYQRFKLPVYMVFLYPVSVILMGAISTSSMILTLSGRATWKDRKMPKRKMY
jgi:chlorobactene glucosyltransferase